MKKTRKSLLMALLAFGVCTAVPLNVYAQDQNPSDTVVQDLELEQADIRDALRQLFHNVGISYEVASEVQGTVTVSLHNVPFETALQDLLKQVDATYRVDGGVFNIIKKEPPPAIDVTAGTADTTVVAKRKRLYRFRIMHADPYIIYQELIGKVGMGLPPEISTTEVSGGGGAGGFGGGGFGGGMGGGMGGGFGGGMGGGGFGGIGGGMMGGGFGGGMGGGGFGGGMGGGFGGGGFGGGGGIGGRGY